MEQKMKIPAKNKAPNIIHPERIEMMNNNQNTRNSLRIDKKLTAAEKPAIIPLNHRRYTRKPTYWEK